MILRRYILCALAALAVAAGASAADKVRWEEVTVTVQTPAAATDADSKAPVISVRDGYVYVVVREPVTVKLFTILGQLIAQETLRPGTYRYRLSARGIYLLKAGEQTRRITV